MEHELQGINLEGALYIVDARLDALIELGNERNLLRFSEMDYTDTHYELKYQPDTRQIASKREIEIRQYMTVKLPHLTSLDPEGMAERCQKTASEIRGMTDYDALVDPKALELRMKGELPRVEILGHTYYADVRMGSIRPKDEFQTGRLNAQVLNQYFSPDGSHYRVPMDPVTREIREVNWEKITEIPKNIVLVDIPSIQRLDPVGYARDLKLEPKQFLRNHPPRQEHVARQVNWSDTLVHEIILANRIRDSMTRLERTIRQDVRQKERPSRQQKPKNLH
ncbi:hypothetical protein [Arachidicoccus terrestris]|uniref:hypothetical protein n=1 Tax=Arachidicoccus terrestris TaxID=2875539 RepID=UPI001CC412B8|nr:hypothetical protein [Arachidicoccus terrestris]UAY55766.1 hypothetical protein K9M52_01650 [Arachidicoccus terrestris]